MYTHITCRGVASPSTVARKCNERNCASQASSPVPCASSWIPCASSPIPCALSPIPSVALAVLVLFLRFDFLSDSRIVCRCLRFESDSQGLSFKSDFLRFNFESRPVHQSLSLEFDCGFLHLSSILGNFSRDGCALSR